MDEWVKWLAVAAGGSLGTVCRYGISLWSNERYGSAFPYGTLIVNIVGCFIIGLFMTLITERLMVNQYWRLTVSVGFLGGLTTFSSFSFETWRLLLAGEALLALGNILLNLIIGLAATWLGIAIAKVL